MAAKVEIIATTARSSTRLNPFFPLNLHSYELVLFSVIIIVDLCQTSLDRFLVRA